MSLGISTPESKVRTNRLPGLQLQPCCMAARTRLPRCTIIFHGVASQYGPFPVQFVGLGGLCPGDSFCRLQLSLARQFNVAACRAFSRQSLAYDVKIGGAFKIPLLHCAFAPFQATAWGRCVGVEGPDSPYAGAVKSDFAQYFEPQGASINNVTRDSIR